MLERNFLKNKNVLITGGSKGLGKELSLAFASYGANVVINYHSDENAAVDTFNQVSAFGTKVELIKADVGNRDEMIELCKTSLERMGGIDIFIHNAVYAVATDIMSIDANQWQKALDTNLNPLLIGAQQFIPHMKKNRWGKIFAISSRGSVLAVKNYVALGVPKAAMESFIRYLAVEFGPYGIVSNTISPATLDTESLRKVNPEADERVRIARANIPFYRPMEVSDVAKVVVNLCSDDMEMINGEVIHIGGGIRVKG